MNGRLIDDEILESFKNEADSVIGDDLEKFALKIMEITFSRQVHDACNVKPQVLKVIPYGKVIHAKFHSQSLNHRSFCEFERF